MSTTERKLVRDMTVAELRAELEEAGTAVPSGAKKADLAELVLQARVAAGGEEIEGEVVGMEEQEVEFRAEEAERARMLPAVRASEAMVTRGEVTPAEVAGQRDKIREVMESVMQEGVHYGKVPGVNKPTLLKPGAEVLAVTFRFAPHYESERIFHDDGHLTVFSKTTLTHIPTQLVIAEGEGLCTSREKKYAYRSEGRVCPACGSPSIKKSKFPPRENDYPGARRNEPPGWYCHSKVGGCGANFAHDDPAITNQDGGRVANPDLADVYNTVLKMANKRALVAAILNGTAASDIFTQDVEDAGPVAASGSEEIAADGPFEGRRADPAYNFAKSWSELTERLGRILGEDEAREWMGQAIVVATGVADRDALTREQRDIAFQKLVAVLAALDLDIEGDILLTDDHRSVVRGVFGRFLDGEQIDGPAWSLSPSEAETRPQKGQETLLQSVESAEQAGADAPGGERESGPGGEDASRGTTSVDDIPF